MISQLFDLILYRPLFNGLVLFYQYLPFHSLGLVIIFLTLLVRLLLYPLSRNALAAQKKMMKLQPKLEQIQKEYKTDSRQAGSKMLQLYREEKISPWAGFLPLLFQLPILFALYKVFWQGVSLIDPNLLYDFVAHPGSINPDFFGLRLDQPSPVLAAFAGLGQFFQSKTLGLRPEKRDSQFSQMIQKQGLYFFPFFTFFILLKLPAAIGLYWLTTTLFSLVQQKLIINN